MANHKEKQKQKQNVRLGSAKGPHPLTFFMSVVEEKFDKKHTEKRDS